MKYLGNTIANPRCQHAVVRPASRHGAAVRSAPPTVSLQDRHQQALSCTRTVWRRRAGAAVPLLLAIVAAVALA
ncbi:hypothetical protein [Pseudoduganella armeniaca]|uniref:Uncharacterized protein n=1 Tax=Pseudoduganella armeniaca TaxID=2072590 RepID=A0A2R4CB55_9BURK|nr:hypothetical protein [Pseudoduganella armeniaca]AVR96825.1 hypothetical protein C9I28_14940 [Pseudoduganella armeniaca]